MLIDCRWLGMGGAGRATELLLRGLASLQPEGRYVLWGPETVESYRWSSATYKRSSRPPTAGWGQAEMRNVPTHDVALYMHQMRPLRPGPSMTVIYDTIPLRQGGTQVVRTAKRLYLKAATRMSNRIATLSRYAASCIERDLGVSQDKITIIEYPVDHELRDRVEVLRREHPSENVVLFVGRFAPHKNLPRLIDAFPRTRVAADGGRLILVGGTPEEIRKLSGWMGPERKDVELRLACSQDELERLYATSRLLVMPSLEEGFGLPAWEAAICGLPICVSDIPVFREILPEAPSFDPTSSHMATAIDAALASPPSPSPLGPTVEAYSINLVDHVAALSLVH